MCVHVPLEYHSSGSFSGLEFISGLLANKLPGCRDGSHHHQPPLQLPSNHIQTGHNAAAASSFDLSSLVKQNVQAGRNTTVKSSDVKMEP